MGRRAGAPGKDAQILERGLLGLNGLGVSVNCRKLSVSRDKDLTRSRGRRCMPDPTSDEARRMVCSDSIIRLIVSYSATFYILLGLQQQICIPRAIHPAEILGLGVAQIYMSLIVYSTEQARYRINAEIHAFRQLAFTLVVRLWPV